MNPAEQRARATTAQQVRAEVNNAFTDLEHRFAQLAAAAHMEIDEAKAAAGAATARAAAVRDYLDSRVTLVTEPLRRGFFGRVKWLVIGR